jgi:hypothetical protein
MEAKILNKYTGNYITQINDELVMKTPDYAPNQIVTYDTDKHNIHIPSNTNATWYYNSDTNTIHDSEKNTHNCLDVDLQFHPCDKSSEQEWVIQHNDPVNSDDYIRQKHKGKYVVLVRENNPWYLNKDNTVRMPFMEEPEPIEYSLLDNRYAIKIDDQLTPLNTKIEHYTNLNLPKFDMINTILISSMVIVIILLFVTRT